MPKAAPAFTCRSCRTARWSTAKGSCSMRRTTERLAREGYAANTHRTRLHRTTAPRGRADRSCTLVRLILRGMRQRAFVIFNPYVIPRIDPAVARLAPEKMFDLTNVSPVGALAEYRPARFRFIELHDRRHLDPPECCHRSILPMVLWKVSLSRFPWNHGTVLTKKSGPGISPEAIRCVALSDVRSAAHYGLVSDIAPSPKSANAADLRYRRR